MFIKKTEKSVDDEEFEYFYKNMDYDDKSLIIMMLRDFYSFRDPPPLAETFYNFKKFIKEQMEEEVNDQRCWWGMDQLTSALETIKIIQLKLLEKDLFKRRLRQTLPSAERSSPSSKKRI